jgi:hypothetical protein
LLSIGSHFLCRIQIQLMFLNVICQHFLPMTKGNQKTLNFWLVKVLKFDEGANQMITPLTICRSCGYLM